MSRANSPELVGASVYIDSDYPNLYLSDKHWQLTPNKNAFFSMKWLSLVLSSKQYRNLLSSMATGTSISMKNIPKEKVLSIPLRIPNLRKQNDIVLLISPWDSAIEKTERLIDLKKQKTNWALEHLLRSDQGTWDHFEIETLFDIVSDKNHAGEELLSVTQDQGVIPRSSLPGRVMSPTGDTSSYKLIQPGDFAVSLRSFQGGIEYCEYRGLISPAYTVLRPKIAIDSGYLKYFLKSATFIDFYLSQAVIGIRDGKQISIPDLMAISIPLPLLEDQKKIEKSLHYLEYEIGLLKKKLSLLQTQKSFLMSKLLSGEWEAPDMGAEDSK
jgi:type I restriction enzyme S subunit